VTDGGHLQAGQSAEDVADQHQDSEDGKNRDPGQPGPEHDHEDDRGDDDVGRADVEDVQPRRREAAVIYPVGDDPLADAGADQVASGAD
jgi:hypothetical protein